MVITVYLWVRVKSLLWKMILFFVIRRVFMAIRGGIQLLLCLCIVVTLQIRPELQCHVRKPLKSHHQFSSDCKVSSASLIGPLCSYRNINDNNVNGNRHLRDEILHRNYSSNYPGLSALTLMLLLYIFHGKKLCRRVLHNLTVKGSTCNPQSVKSNVQRYVCVCV